MYRNAQLEPSTPPGNSRARKNGESSPSEFSPGLLDLHSFDTELLPEVGLLPFLDAGFNIVMCIWHAG
jgi:kinesin family protein 2/24